MTCLRPHSKEWFAALGKVNPQEATHTRQIIKSAGSDEVCSLCGGEPARNYQITNKWFEGGIPASFRLCDECLSTRASEGEQFALLN
jgi:hypothetical protein